MKFFTRSKRWATCLVIMMGRRVSLRICADVLPLWKSRPEQSNQSESSISFPANRFTQLAEIHISRIWSGARAVFQSQPMCQAPFRATATKRRSVRTPKRSFYRPAVLSNRVYKIDGDHLSRPGPRLVDGLEAMARALHPEAFKYAL